MIIVKSLGKFEISDDLHIMNDEIIRSDMVKKLFMYLLTHRDHAATVQELSEALWREDEVDNPAGALKNLMYRLRTLLKKNLGDAPYIITSQGSYGWNPEIEVELDIEKFEEYYKRAKAVSKQEGLSDYESAVALYRGDFMGNNTENHWAATLSTYYHSMFLNAVKVLSELYLERERYQDMEDLCVYAVQMDNVDEELYCYHIMALIKQNKCELALKRYEEACKILYDALGVRNPAKLQQVQKELLKMSKSNEAESLENIHEDMVEEDSEGVYFCGYPVFREIYRLEVRKNSRLGEAEYIVLFTVETEDNVKTGNEKMERFLIEQGMGRLKSTLGKVLRIGDVAARYSDSQYIVLLPTCTYESSVRVAKRVLEYYSALDKSKKVRIKTDFEQLSKVKSTLVR